MAYIYVIRNYCNNKVYVGQCVCSIEDRFIAHKSEVGKSNKAIHKAMAELGTNNFFIELLEECDNSIRLERETHYINELNSLVPNGYNIQLVGSEGFYGGHHTEESIQKISDSSKRWFKNATEEQLILRAEKIRQANLGKEVSDSTRKKISDFAKTRVGCKNPFYGKHHSEETKRLASERMKGKPFKGSTVISVSCYDDSGNKIETFRTMQDAARWLRSNGYSKAAECSIVGTIKVTIEPDSKYFGKKRYTFYWKREE